MGVPEVQERPRFPDQLEVPLRVVLTHQQGLPQHGQGPLREPETLGSFEEPGDGTWPCCHGYFVKALRTPSVAFVAPMVGFPHPGSFGIPGALKAGGCTRPTV